MRRARVLVIAVALLGSTRSGGQEIPAGNRPPAAIAGRVVAGGFPVETGRVVLRSPGAECQAVVGQHGDFRLAGVAPGWYDASASSPGWMTHRFRVLAGAAGDLVLPEGTIHFSNVPDGGLRLAARAPGYDPQTISIPAASREPVVLMLERLR